MVLELITKLQKQKPLDYLHKYRQNFKIKSKVKCLNTLTIRCNDHHFIIIDLMTLITLYMNYQLYIFFLDYRYYYILRYAQASKETNNKP